VFCFLVNNIPFLAVKIIHALSIINNILRVR
jgi:hypothetical protein